MKPGEHDALLPAFKPAWWLPGAHGQTLGARFLRPGAMPLRRERWATPDGDFLDLDFVATSDLCDNPLVLVLHGLEGSSRSGYAIQLYRQLSEKGFFSVGLNFRSCSGELNRGRRLYHSGETADLGWVIERLQTRFAGRRLAVVGVSLGGNVLLKYLGEQGDKAGPEAAAVWSVPFDLPAGASVLEAGFARFYVWHLLPSLKRKAQARADLSEYIDLERALAASTFREFDDAATAPLHGFRDAEDYYQQCSSKNFLPAIRIPTLVLHAKDDPFLPAAAIPTAVLAANPNITPVITDRGGHVGFVAGAWPGKPHFWAEDLIATWFAELLGTRKK